jgi:DNA-binding IclR family transcriptional regulator
MFKLSKLTDYAVVVLVRLARTDGVQTSPGIAAATGIPEPTVAKVLKILTGSGLVSSQRGARGGYRLARRTSSPPSTARSRSPPASITARAKAIACVPCTAVGTR